MPQSPTRRGQAKSSPLSTTTRRSIASHPRRSTSRGTFRSCRRLATRWQCCSRIELIETTPGRPRPIRLFGETRFRTWSESMSEYQYYEFLAVDRRLGERELREIRAVSSRAEITPTSFVNEYNYGDFKGDELEFLERYFDLHVYVANWGTHRFMVRLPKDAIDVGVAKRYGGKYDFMIHARRDAVILDFTSQEEGGDWEEGEGYMRDLLPVRTELLRGDE